MQEKPNSINQEKSPEISNPGVTQIPMAPVGAIPNTFTPPPVQPVKKSYKKHFIATIVIAVLILLSIAGGLLYLSSKSTPADTLQNTLVTVASTNTITQTAKISGSIDGTNTKSDVFIESDFSDPANPKSKGTVSMEFFIFESEVSLKSEFICVSKTECYIKYSEYEFSDDLGVEEYPYLNKWLQFDPTNDISYADQFGSVSDLNTVLGDIIIGNITGDAKTKIEQMAKEGTTYTFTNAYNEELDGMQALTFDLQLNKDKVVELNKVIAKQYGLDADVVNEDITEKMKIWVATDTNQIVKAESDFDGVKISVMFSKYNEPVTFTAPTDFLSPDEYVTY